MNIKETECLGFRSLSIDNGIIRIDIVPEIGGRVMFFGYPDHNLLFTNSELQGIKAVYEAKSPELLQEERLKQGLMLYGGEKIWLAPQEEWGHAPYVDMDHGEYSCEVKRENDCTKIILTSPICRETQLQLTKTLTIQQGEAHVHFGFQLANYGEKPISKGIWQVTQLNRPAEVRIAANHANKLRYSSYYGNAAVSEEGAMIRNSVDHAERYKFGVSSDRGELSVHMGAVQLHQNMSVNDATYPHGFMFEVFNSDRYPYFEAELHSPLLTIEPQSSAAFEITWRLARGAVD
ncbi:MAG: DUF4380 domain-containing protein [Candidatus Pristimantibacillus sp.]